MIPSTYQFKNIYGEPGLHPGVAAEIAAARDRASAPPPTRRQAFGAWLRRLMPAGQTTSDWSGVPAE